MIKKLLDSIIGNPIIEPVEPDIDAYPYYTWRYPRILRLRAWLYGGHYNPGNRKRAEYFRGFYVAPLHTRAFYRLKRWVKSLQGYWIGFLACLFDVRVLLTRAWFDLIGRPYHLCSQCQSSDGVCLNAVRSLQAKPEVERVEKLRRSSMSNDLIRLRQQRTVTEGRVA